MEDGFHGIDYCVGRIKSPSWTNRRGRTSTILLKDDVLKKLMTTKHAGSWDFVSCLFRMKDRMFEWTVMNAIENIAEVLFDSLVTNWEKKYTIVKLADNKTLLSNYISKCAWYDTDVTSRQDYWPAGYQTESEIYSSNNTRFKATRLRPLLYRMG